MMALYVGEAIVAIFLIIMFLLVVFSQEEIETKADLKEIGLKALKILDQNDELRKYAMANDTETIKNKLSNLLPYQVSYEVYVCKDYCLIPSSGEEIASVSYLLAGNFGSLEPREVILRMW
ncbi:MAG: hypothetical protein ACP5O8_01465 [Candidatus Aenigmatarchaeota archaeon]